MSRKPGVGVATFIRKHSSKSHSPGDDFILLGRRKGRQGEGKYALPGGHLEFGEDLLKCGEREVEEETSLKLKNVSPGMAYNAIWREKEKDYHYIIVILTADLDEQYSTEPITMEPDKNYGWEWHSWSNLPPRVQQFKPLAVIKDSGFNPFCLENTEGIVTLKDPCFTENGTSGQQKPGVGVSVFITSESHPNCVLLGKRKAKIGQAKYGTPGGHVEYGESWKESAIREVREETALQISDVHLGKVFNIIWEEEGEPFHYIDTVMVADIDSTSLKVKNCEPHKCEGWEWFNWKQFPPKDEVFKPLQMIKDSGFNPFIKSTMSDSDDIFILHQ